MDSNDSGHVQSWKANVTWWVPYGLLPRTSLFLDLGRTRLDQIPKLGSLCQARVSVFYDARGTTREITFHRIIWHDHTWTRRAAKHVLWLKHLIDSMSSGLDEKIVLLRIQYIRLIRQIQKNNYGENVLYPAVIAAWQTVRVINKSYFWLREDIWTCLVPRQQKRHLRACVQCVFEQLLLLRKSMWRARKSNRTRLFATPKKESIQTIECQALPANQDTTVEITLMEPPNIRIVINWEPAMRARILARQCWWDDYSLSR